MFNNYKMNQNELVIFLQTRDFCSCRVEGGNFISINYGCTLKRIELYDTKKQNM